LSDPRGRVLVMEDGGRLARFGVQLVAAALAGQARRVVAADRGETARVLGRDMTWVPAGGCARRGGRRGARNRTLRTVTATRNTGSGLAA
jgi:putative resolvase